MDKKKKLNGLLLFLSVAIIITFSVFHKYLLVITTNIGFLKFLYYATIYLCMASTAVGLIITFISAFKDEFDIIWFVQFLNLCAFFLISITALIFALNQNSSLNLVYFFIVIEYFIMNSISEVYKSATNFKFIKKDFKALFTNGESDKSYRYGLNDDLERENNESENLELKEHGNSEKKSKSEKYNLPSDDELEEENIADDNKENIADNENSKSINNDNNNESLADDNDEVIGDKNTNNIDENNNENEINIEKSKDKEDNSNSILKEIDSDLKKNKKEKKKKKSKENIIDDEEIKATISDEKSENSESNSIEDIDDDETKLNLNDDFEIAKNDEELNTNLNNTKNNESTSILEEDSSNDLEDSSINNDNELNIETFNDNEIQVKSNIDNENLEFDSEIKNGEDLAENISFEKEDSTNTLNEIDNENLPIDDFANLEENAPTNVLEAQELVNEILEENSKTKNKKEDLKTNNDSKLSKLNEFLNKKK